MTTNSRPPIEKHPDESASTSRDSFTTRMLVAAAVGCLAINLFVSYRLNALSQNADSTRSSFSEGVIQGRAEARAVIGPLIIVGLFMFMRRFRNVRSAALLVCIASVISIFLNFSTSGQASNEPVFDDYTVPVISKSTANRASNTSALNSDTATCGDSRVTENTVFRPDQFILASVDQSVGLPMPYYSRQLPRDEQRRSVTVDVYINEKGEVAKALVFVSSGIDAIDSAAVNQALKWRFVPGMYDGKPTCSWLSVLTKFRKPGSTDNQ